MAPDESDHAHIALVVVHGMGAQRRGETLLEWAEPLVVRIHALVRRGAEDDAQTGVVIRRVDLSGDDPVVVVVDVTTASGGVLRTRRLRITEARWSESFLAMTNSDVFGWGAKFVWKAIARMIVHFSRTVFLAPVAELLVSMRQHVPVTPTGPSEGPPNESGPRRFARRLVAAGAFVPVVLLTGVIVAAGAVGVVMLGIVLSALLPLLSVLLLVPAVSSVLRPVTDRLVQFVGDVGVWREKPVRAAAMRQVIHDEILSARDHLTGDDAVLAVLAHSQGAAMTARVLFREYDHSVGPAVSSFTTVGAAVMLLGNTRGLAGRGSTFTPVAEWLTVRPPIVWRNFWAIWDPFAAGPIADSRRGRQSRWWLAYGHRQRADIAGPAEYPVHNTAQPFTDHQSYASNTLQVIDPIARDLLGLPPEPGDRLRRDNRRHVRSVKSRGVLSLAGVVLALLVVSSPAARTLVAGWIVWLGDAISGVLGLLSSVLPDPVGAGFSFDALVTPSRDLTPFGAVCAAIATVVLAVLVGGWFRNGVRRGLEERRDGNATTMWLILEACVRLFVLSLVGWVAADRIGTATLDDVARTVALVAVLVALVAAFFSPFLARVPSVVPERRPSDRRRPPVE